MAETIGTAYVQIEPSFDGAVQKIDKEFGGAGKESGKSFSGGFASVVGTVGKVAMGAAAAGTAAVAGLTKQATDSFANYQQLVGGVETLFSDSADTVLANADRAFTTAGLSANDYMETVTSFSASLLQSLDGDTARAAETADRAIIDMSDNANKMGTSMESIQNAYQGFAKQNYTMLDNLKLGYGGTKEEMKRLLADAGKIAGVKFDISSYADIIDAIHVMQESMGIAETTSIEAASTISGSMASVKSSWENVLTAIGTGDADKINETINQLVETAGVFAQNMIPTIEASLGGISQLISQLAPEIAEIIPELINTILPSLLSAAVDIVTTLCDGIVNTIPTLLPTVLSAGLDIAKALSDGLLSAVPTLLPVAFDVINSLIQLFMELAPQLIQTGFDIILQLANGIAEALPTLIPQIVEVVLQIVQTIIDNIPMLISAANDIVVGLLDGIITALPMLLDALPGLITSVIDALLQSLPIIIQGFTQIFTMLVQHLPEIIQELIEAAPQILFGIIGALAENAPLLIEAFVQLFIAVAQALPDIIMVLVESIPQSFIEIANAFMGILPILLDTFSQIFTQLAPVFMQLGQYAQMAWEAIKTAFGDVGTWLKTKFTTAVNNVKTVFNTLKTFFKSTWEAIKNVFSDVGTKFLEVGKGIVSGIQKGLSSSWDNLKAFLQKACGDLVALAKKILGIGSPSREFADQVGRWIPAGIAQGIKNNLGVIDTAIHGMTSDVLETSVSGTVRTINSMNYEPSQLASAGETVVINNNIKVDGAQDPEAWTQTFIRTLKREARMA